MEGRRSCAHIVVRAIVHLGRRVLLVRQVQQDRRPFSGLWYFAGGFLKAGEHPFECATREVFEEAGVHVTVERVLDMEVVRGAEKSEGTCWDLFICFVACCALSSQIAIGDSEEIDKAVWVDADVVQRYVSHSGMLPEGVSCFLRELSTRG